MGEPNSQSVNDFQGRPLPEAGRPAGYAALIEKYRLPVPLPKQLTAVAERHVKTSSDDWQILTPRRWAGGTLSGHRTFALKRERAELGFLAGLFEPAPGREIGP